MRYRVEQLAAACDVSVDTVRYYQSRGPAPAARARGRVAWYGAEHAERIGEIRRLQRKGLTLAAIRRVVARRARPRRCRPRRRGRRRARRRRASPRAATPHARGLLRGVGRAGLADPGGRARGHPARPAGRRRDALHHRRHRARAHRAAPARVRPAARRSARARARHRRRDAGRSPSARSSCSTITCASRSATPPATPRAAAEQLVEAFRELLPAVTDARVAPLPAGAARDRRGHIEVERRRRDGLVTRAASARRARRRRARSAVCSTRSRPATTS